jgi:hypothetical protein
VETLAQNVLKHYHEASPPLYERCAQDAAAEPTMRAAEEADRRGKWARLDGLAAAAAERGAAHPSYAAPLAQVTAVYKQAAAGGGAGGMGRAYGVSGSGYPGAPVSRPLSTSTAAIMAMAGAGSGR